MAEKTESTTGNLPPLKTVATGQLYDDIKDFHQKFGLEYSGPPRRLPIELDGFRTKFMGEELAEYISPQKGHHAEVTYLIESLVRRMNGMAPQTLENQLDALVDLVYVALGTAYLHGFDFNEAWRRVHEANMAKVRAVNEGQSLRGSTFDVVKPAGWKPADLSDLVR